MTDHAISPAIESARASVLYAVRERDEARAELDGIKTWNAALADAGDTLRGQLRDAIKAQDGMREALDLAQGCDGFDPIAVEIMQEKVRESMEGLAQ